MSKIRKNTYLVYSTPMCCCKLLEKCTDRFRGPRGACGKLVHGKRVDGSSVRVCFARGRLKGDTTAEPSRPLIEFQYRKQH